MKRYALIVALALLACSDTEFTPRWRLDRFRLLAVIAEPPDALAGESVTLTAVAAQRPGVTGDASVVWLPCARLAIDNNTGARTCADATPQVLFGTTTSVALTETPASGAPWTVFGMACPSGVPMIDPTTKQPRCDGAEGEVFIRTIRQRGAVANHNPRIARVTLDGAELTAEMPARVPPCALTDSDERDERCVRHSLRVEFASDARETTSEVQPDGSVHALPEALVTEFIVDGGDLDGAFRSDNDESAGAVHVNAFRAPPTAGTVRLWVIARDGRGGFDIATRSVTVAM